MRYLPIALLLLSSYAPGQSDDCSNATAISGQGSWAFDTTAFTTSQFDGGGCLNSDADIDQDCFFLWRSTFEGTAFFDTFGSSFDTRLRVHNGRDCAAVCQGHNDDSGNLQSSLRIGGVQLGEAYLIQVGGFAGALGTGVLNIHAAGCATGLGDRFEDNDTAATAALFPPSFRQDLTIDASDPDFYLLPVPAGYRARVSLSLWSYSQSTELLDGAGLIVTPRSSSGSEILWKFSNTTGSQVDYQLGIGSASSQCSPYGIEFSVELDDCGLLTDDAFEDNDTCASPTTLTPGVYKGLLGFLGDPDVYEVVVPPGVILTVFGDMPGLADSITNYFGAGFLACSSPLIEARFQFGYLNYANTTNAPQSVLFVVQPPGHLGPECYGYDLSVHLDPDYCGLAAPDPFDQRRQTWVEDGVYAGLIVDTRRADSYDVCVPANGTISIDVLFNVDDGDIAIDLLGTGLGAIDTTTDNEHVTWTNPTNSDVHARLYVRIPGYPYLECNTYDLVVQGTCDCHEQVGSHFCPQVANASWGFGCLPWAELRCGALGSGLQLQFQGGPPNQFGMVLMSSQMDDHGISLGLDELCLLGPIVRFNRPGVGNSIGVFDSMRTFRSLTGNGDPNGMGFEIPIGSASAGNLITAGDTKHFQLWYRLPGGNSGVSSGLSVTF